MVPPLRKQIGKAGLLPGCQVKDRVPEVHLDLDVDLVAHAAGKVPEVHSDISSASVAHSAPGRAGAMVARVGKVIMVRSALVLALGGIGAYQMNSWRCVLRQRR